MTVDLREHSIEILDVTPRHASARIRNARSALVEATAVCAGLVAMFGASAQPVGIPLADGVYRGVAAGLLVWFAARARRWTWGLLTLGGLVLSASLAAQLLAVVALAIFIHSLLSRRRTPQTGAAIAFLVLPGLFGQGPDPLWRLSAGVVDDPFAMSSLLAAAVCAPTIRTGWRSVSRRRRRSVRRIAKRVASAAGLVVIASGAVCLVALPTMVDALRLTQVAADDATNGELADAADAFDEAQAKWNAANRIVSGPWMLPARLLPIAGQNVRAAQVVTGQASALSDAAAEVTRRVRPDDVLADGVINIEAIDEITPAMDALAATAERASVRIDHIDSSWLLPPIAERVGRAREVLTPASGVLGAAAEGLHVGRDLLGGDEPSTILVLLTTPAEARGSGGFVGSWVVMQGAEGSLHVAEHYRSNELNALLEANDATLDAPADYETRYERFAIDRHVQDVTMSPDFPSVATVTADVFEQATGQQVDAVIKLDPFVLQQLIAFTGPIEADEIRLTGSSAANVLLVDQYASYENDEAGRESALLEATRLLTERLLAEPPDPIAFASELAPLADQDRINVWLADDEGGTTAERLGLAGEFEVGAHDTFALVHQNAGQNKIDSFLERAIDLETIISPASGTVDHFITVTLDNTVVDLDLPPAIVASNDQGLPTGTNRMIVSNYSNHALRSARLNGRPAPVESDVEFGLAVYSIVLDLQPGEFATLELHLQGALADPTTYEFTMGAQPLVNDDAVRWHLRTDDGSRITPPSDWSTRRDGVRWAGALDKDRTFTFGLRK